MFGPDGVHRRDIAVPLPMVTSLFFGGEGLVCQFSGQGRLWISTRNPASLASLVAVYRPRKSG